jgi:hypothetical protein
VSVSISVITGVLASVGKTTLFTLFLTSLTISFESAHVFRVSVIKENQREELELILSIHFMSLISLYILSVIKLSMSFGFVQG